MIGVGDRGGDEARTLQMLQGTIPLGSLALTTWRLPCGGGKQLQEASGRRKRETYERFRVFQEAT